METRKFVACHALVVALGLFGVSAATYLPGSAAAQNPHTLTGERVLHTVRDHTAGQIAPEIGFVVDEARDVVCYFPMRHHWYDVQPTISCVFLGVQMLADDPMGR